MAAKLFFARINLFRQFFTSADGPRLKAVSHLAKLIIVGHQTALPVRVPAPIVRC